MKSKAKKEKELGRAEELLKESGAVAFFDFSGISAENLRKFRKEAKEAGATLLVIKKRLLDVLFKNREISYSARELEGSVGAVFAKSDLEGISGVIYRFLAGLGEKEDKEKNVSKILGAYDLRDGAPIDAAKVTFYGTLPPREVLLGQLLGMLVAPIRGFMYLLSEKAKKVEA